MGEVGLPPRRSPRFDFIAGTGARVPAGDDSVWWRVTAANNRTLGRSAATFVSMADCRDHARSVQDRIDDLVPSYASDARGQWSWSALLDATLTATSTRPFARRLDCIRTLGLFLDAARTADVERADVRRLVGRARSDSAQLGSR
jgi:hypothetical protein